MSVELRAPAPQALITTDMPAIEGTLLLQHSLHAPQGTFTFAQVWPIRGTYQLKVRAQPISADTPPVAEEFQISVGDQPPHLRNLILLGLGLVAFGLVSGLVLGRSARARKEA